MTHWGGERELLTLIIGPHTCPTCLEPKASRLHHEICLEGQ